MAGISSTLQNNPSDARFRVEGEAVPQGQLRCPSCNRDNRPMSQHCMWCGYNLSPVGAQTTQLRQHPQSSQVQPYQGSNQNPRTVVYNGQGPDTKYVSPSSIAPTQVIQPQNQRQLAVSPQYGQQVQPVNPPAYPQYGQQYPQPQYPQYPQYQQPTVVIHHTQTVVVANQKSVGLAVFLAFVFGPLGMLYSTVLGGTIIFALNVFLLFSTFGTTWPLTWVVGMVWAAMAAQAHNSKAVTTYQQTTTYPPNYYQQP